MEFIDSERSKGNELCQAIVNLPPLDSLFSEVQAFLLSSGKQQAVIDKVDASMADDTYKQLKRALTCDFDPDAVMPGILVAAEAFAITWTGLPTNITDLNGDADLVAAVKKTFNDLGLLLQPLVDKNLSLSLWQVLGGHMSGLMVKIDDLPVGPSGDCLAECKGAVGKLKLMRIGLNICFSISTEACSTTKLEMLHSCQTAWSQVQAISAAIEVVNVVVDV